VYRYGLPCQFGGKIGSPVVVGTLMQNPPPKAGDINNKIEGKTRKYVFILFIFTSSVYILVFYEYIFVQNA